MLHAGVLLRLLQRERIPDRHTSVGTRLGRHRRRAASSSPDRQGRSILVKVGDRLQRPLLQIQLSHYFVTVKDVMLTT